MQELMRLQQSESFVRPQTLRHDLPAAAQTLIINALSFEPRRRPQNARIFAEDLAQALTGNIKVAGERPTIAVPSPPGGSDRSPSREMIADVASLETLPMTQVKTEGVRTTDKTPPALSSAPNLLRTTTTPMTAAQATTVKPKGSKLPIMAGLIIVIIAAAIAVKTLMPSAQSGSTPVAAESPTPQAPESAASQPSTPQPEAPNLAGAEEARTINYSVTMQKDPKRYPGRGPYQVPGEVVFSPGDRVHFSFISPQRGYLYIINESPPTKGQASSFNLLFPTPTSNQGSAQLAAGQTVRIPDHDIGFVFDEEQGTEKLWLIWAAGAVAELEPLKRWANPQDLGAVKDAAQIETLRAFLAEHSAAKPQVTQDETSKQTMVKMKGDILVKLVNLQHY